MRQSEDDYLDYVNSISYLREKYKNKIKIFIGYEAEYQKENREFLTNLLGEGKIEYLILGNHCFFEDNHMHHWYASFRNDLFMMNKYFDNTNNVFVENGFVPSIDFLPTDVEVDADKQIIVDGSMSSPYLEGIFACGNALHIHDLVDYVSLEAKKCGRACGEYILKGQKDSETIKNHIASGVSYVVPQAFHKGS